MRENMGWEDILDDFVYSKVFPPLLCSEEHDFGVMYIKFARAQKPDKGARQPTHVLTI